MNPIELPLGPVMLDVLGHQLADDDRARLLHPLTGGVILFQRNYASPEQIAELCADIRALRTPELLIAVDHEGGRVQRFREGYTPIPPMADLGALWDTDPGTALRNAEAVGLVIATELIASGVDFSFTPVLDLDYGRSRVIGTRAFHSDADGVGELASALIAGLARGGAAAVGKHFPGHGFAGADSHVEIPVDPRTLAEIRAMDLAPYRRLVRELRGVMPAHVIYPEVDRVPAGFSRVWLQDVLRNEIGFDGLIFSDDLSMEAASVAGGHRGARGRRDLGRLRHGSGVQPPRPRGRAPRRTELERTDSALRRTPRAHALEETLRLACGCAHRPRLSSCTEASCRPMHRSRRLCARPVADS